jgi:hypothetical protein
MFFNCFAQAADDECCERQPFSGFSFIFPNDFTGVSDINFEESVNNVSSTAQVSRVDREPAHWWDWFNIVCVLVTHISAPQGRLTHRFPSTVFGLTLHKMEPDKLVVSCYAKQGSVSKGSPTEC